MKDEIQELVESLPWVSTELQKRARGYNQNEDPVMGANYTRYALRVDAVIEALTRLSDELEAKDARIGELEILIKELGRWTGHRCDCSSCEGRAISLREKARQALSSEGKS